MTDATPSRTRELEAALRDARKFTESWRYMSAEAAQLLKRIDRALEPTIGGAD